MIDPQPTADAADGPSPGRFSRRQRAVAGVLLAVFAAAAVLTTALSLGRYCLTTDGSDIRALAETLRSLFP